MGLTKLETDKVMNDVIEIMEIADSLLPELKKMGIFNYKNLDKEKRIVVLAVGKFVQEQYNLVKYSAT